jgi:hypothetical protein
VDVINLVNAIEQRQFPLDLAPSDPLLRIKFHSRVCLAWG